MDTAALELTVVIPSFNQRARPPRSAAGAAPWLEQRFQGRSELIVVDDGSRADEGVTAAALPAGVILGRPERHTGKGGGLCPPAPRGRGVRASCSRTPTCRSPGTRSNAPWRRCAREPTSSSATAST